jgi:RNA polymerase-binding transcription factor DksA
MTKDYTEFTTKLSDEKTLLVKELGNIGSVKNPKNPNDWEARPSNLDIDHSDTNEVGDLIESYEGNTALVHELEGRLMEIDIALDKISNGTFGTCEVCSKMIEEDRLQANPAAKTCKQHMNN